MLKDPKNTLTEEQVNNLFKGFEKKIYYIQKLTKYLISQEKQDKNAIRNLKKEHNIENIKTILQISLKNGIVKGLKMHKDNKISKKQQNLLKISLK